MNIKKKLLSIIVSLSVLLGYACLTNATNYDVAKNSSTNVKSIEVTAATRSYSVEITYLDYKTIPVNTIPSGGGNIKIVKNSSGVAYVNRSITGLGTISGTYGPGTTCWMTLRVCNNTNHSVTIGVGSSTF